MSVRNLLYTIVLFETLLTYNPSLPTRRTTYLTGGLSRCTLLQQGIVVLFCKLLKHVNGCLEYKTESALMGMG